MEKSVAHWRAAHPLVFISGSLCLGILIASQFPLPTRIYGETISLIILLSTMFLLVLEEKYKVLDKWSGFFIFMVLLSWGIALFFTSVHFDLFSIPYPIDFIHYLREMMVAKINAVIKNKEANGFAQALLIGIKTDMSKSLVEAYVQMGVIHIIAISGMHLEIIFKNLVFITKWLPRKKIFIYFELLFILGTVWLYTFIAFASPSVVRASLFFTIYFLGDFLNQSKYTLNCIAGGLLILLLFNVNGIHHIGLQLSYAAVIGIHLFYPLISKSMPMDNIILKWCWNNFSVTVAAQITTLPLLLFYFHQTSTIVLVSNFVMVPLSNILLYALVILIVIPMPRLLVFYMGNLIEKYILLINRWIQYFYSHSLQTSIHLKIKEWETIYFYFILFLVYLWLYKIKTKYLLLALSGIALLWLIKLFSS